MRRPISNFNEPAIDRTPNSSFYLEIELSYLTPVLVELSVSAQYLKGVLPVSVRDRC